MRLKILGLISLAAVLLAHGVTEVHAAPFGSAEEAAFVEAQSYWGGAAPTRCSSITREVVPPGSLDGPDAADSVGRATMPEPGTVVPCGVWIVSGLRPCKLRYVMAHEYGHLLGYGHTEEPENVMNPLSGQAPFCRAEVAREEATEDRRDFALLRRECRRESHPRERRACWRSIRQIRREVSY